MGTYSIAGLGKLGASMAGAIASQGHTVIGVDVVPATIEAVNAGRAPVQETNLDATIAAHRDRIRATPDMVEAVHASEITFVVVPTPSDDRGAFDITYAARAFAEIGKALATKDGYHLVVLTSTVLPGATRYGLVPLLEQNSGKRAGVDFGVCYSPEFIALGSILRDFLNPDFTLIGEIDQRSGDVLEAAYAGILANGAPSVRMSLENAEMAKVAVNTYVTTKITFANMLADLCNRIPGGDVDAVTRALGMDKRIGAKYLTGALGYGGPCFPRDNVALSFIARALGTEAPLAEVTDRVNRAYPANVLNDVIADAQPGQRAAVLGLSYKPASHVTEESQSVELARTLVERGMEVRAYDPLVAATGLGDLAGRVTLAASVAEAIAGADVVLVTTPDAAFRSLTAADFAAAGKPVRVVDFWRLLDGALAGREGIDYVPFGRGQRDDEAATVLTRLWGE